MEAQRGFFNFRLKTNKHVALLLAAMDVMSLQTKSDLTLLLFT